MFNFLQKHFLWVCKSYCKRIMSVVIIEAEKWKAINQQLNAMERLLESIAEEKNYSKQDYETRLKNFDLGWVHIKVVLPEMGISRKSWNRTYKKFIIYKGYGNDIWVQKESLLNFYKTGIIRPGIKYD